jgi:hypothetical protein
VLHPIYEDNKASKIFLFRIQNLAHLEYSENMKCVLRTLNEITLNDVNDISKHLSLIQYWKRKNLKS